MDSGYECPFPGPNIFLTRLSPVRIKDAYPDYGSGCRQLKPDFDPVLYNVAVEF